MFPTEINDCCKMLGMAMAAIFFSSGQEKSGILPETVMFVRRFKTRATEKIQIIPCQRKVANATPAMPMENVCTKRMSTKILAVEDTARKRKGVLESPNAEKMPVAIL